MSNTLFPTGIDSPAYDPQTTDTLASASHHTLHGFANDAILALETKLGYGSADNSPVTGSMLLGVGTGQSEWLTTLTSFSITTSFLDANGKTWIGQTAIANAVNYVNIANAATTGTPAISSLGTDNNINLNLVPKGSGKIQDNGSNLIDFRNSFSSFAESGGVWSQNTGLIGSMTALTLWIAGIEYTVGAIGSHTFGASVDTYIDYTVGTGITYTAVSNGSTSGFTLAANSLRLAKVVTGSSSISSITQIGGDSIGNLFLPPGPVYTTKISNPIKFSVYRSASWTTGSAAFTIVTFDTKLDDSGVNYNTSTGLFTCTVAGFYQLNWRAATAAGVTRAVTRLNKNNGTEVGRGGDLTTSSANQGSAGSRRVQLAINDTLEVDFFTSGAVSGDVGIGETYFDGYLMSAN